MSVMLSHMVIDEILNITVRCVGACYCCLPRYGCNLDVDVV
jgi:hypothetical protein